MGIDPSRSYDKAPPERGFSFVALFIAFPIIIVGSTVFGGMLSPLFGPFGMFAVPILTLVVLVVTLKDPPDFLRSPSTLVFLLSVACWILVGGVGYFVGSIAFHVNYGTPTCGEQTTITVDACRGRDHSFLQGRHSYAEVRGRPDHGICRALLDGKDKPVNDGFTIREERPCPASWDDGPYRCFFSQHMGGGSDMRRSLTGYTADCARGRAFSSVAVDIEEVEGKVRALDWGPPNGR